MFENLDIFRMSSAMARHAGTRQALIAQNMANADTPGYAARDLKPFQAYLETDTGDFHPRATRAAHLHGAGVNRPYSPAIRPGAEADPNGNSVSLETEMVNAVEVKRQHDRALAIYKHSLTVLRSAVSTR
ncbi:FlgB family protein [Roseovarius sp. A21]|uniref:Flagellar basal body rod protein FlgB n=1 Tax=Roseovarius bejariae TaxID=2576383 RepID=A0A844CTU9_9RHOB|nr:FlgB family protein [Roseovarius bejariae]MRU15449.1 FlgB family protein [Roseovarius bejariae]